MQADQALEAIADPRAAAVAATRFAVDVVGPMAARSTGNLAVSPLSIFDALALLAPGARGDSAARLGAALHVESTGRELTASVARLHSDLGSDDAELRLACAAWLQQDFPVVQDYAELLRMAGAPPRLVDFVKDPEAARRAINAWVKDNTAGRIRNFLPPGALDVKTRLALVSAVALDARWALPFRPAETTDAPFEAPSGRRPVPTMHLRQRLAHAAADAYRAVRLPYAGGRLTGVVALPEPGVDPLDLVSMLCTPSARDAFAEVHVDLRLPRFELTSAPDLAVALRALGLGPLFMFHEADFSGIGARPGELRLDVAVHKAWLQVDELGTKGAAATGLSMQLVSRPIYRDEVTLTVDRPFLFMVEDVAHGVPVFVARVVDPAQ